MLKITIVPRLNFLSNIKHNKTVKQNYSTQIKVGKHIIHIHILQTLIMIRT